MILYFAVAFRLKKIWAHSQVTAGLPWCFSLRVSVGEYLKFGVCVSVLLHLFGGNYCENLVDEVLFPSPGNSTWVVDANPSNLRSFGEHRIHLHPGILT
jgi:hypothetical protein